jgi:DeoR/GlpR family transcriptional regulator of sugar metabolism
LNNNASITFTHGGVIYNGNKLTINKGNNNSNKMHEIIGKKGASLIKNNEVIFIDSGYTAAEMSKYVAKTNISGLTILTTSIIVAQTIGNNLSGCVVNLIGGQYRDSYYSLVGPIAEYTCKTIKTNIAFVSTIGLSQKGFFTANAIEMSLRKIVCSSTQEVVLLADETKFNNETGFLVEPLDVVDKIITNDINSIDNEIKNLLQQKNIELI